MPLVSVEVILRHTLLVLMAISTTDTPLGSLNLRAPYGYLIGYFQLLYACLSVRQENWRGFGPNFWCFVTENFEKKKIYIYIYLTFILRRSRTGTVCFYTSTSNKRAARPKLYTKSLTRDLKLMYSRFTLMRISIKL